MTQDEGHQLPGGEAAGRTVIARVAAVLRTLEREPDGLTISRVARGAGLPRSTVQRLVAALNDEQLVSVAEGRVRLGPALARLAVAAHLNVAQQIRPYLERLARETGETVALWVARGGQVVLVDQIVSRHELRVVTPLGVTLPMSCTATGKALLAQLPDDVVAATLGEHLEKRTANSITTLDALLGQLAEVRSSRLAYDFEEHVCDVCAIATALSIGAIERYAITIPVPARRFRQTQDALRLALLRCREAMDGGEKA